MNTRYVKKAKDGRWDILKVGHRRATAHGRTKAAAIETARKLALQEGGGEIRVLNRTGKLIEQTRVRPPRRAAA